MYSVERQRDWTNGFTKMVALYKKVLLLISKWSGALPNSFQQDSWYKTVKETDQRITYVGGSSPRLTTD